MLEVFQYRAFAPGPRLIVTGAVHGNEVCGTEAIRRLIAELAQGTRRITRGQLTLIPVTNPFAYQAGRREGDRNLNRDFRVYAAPQCAEDHVATALAPLLEQHDALLDLHSFSAPGTPFVFLGPDDNRGALEPFARAREETALALATGLPRLVCGWLPAYASGAVRRTGGNVAYGIGTTEYMRARGGYAITVECGQHADPTAPDVAWNAIEGALSHLELCAPTGSAPQVQPDRSAPQPEWIELVTVFDRLHADDHFIRTWKSFDRLAQGDVIALRHDGTPIHAPEDGYVVFPNPGTAVGREWFYLARISDRGTQHSGRVR